MTGGNGVPIEVEIEELTLHGFDPRDARAIGDAMRAEIAEALAGWRPGPAGSGSGAGFGDEPPTLDAGAVRVAAGTAPGQVGRSVGAQVARALRDSHGTSAGGGRAAGFTGSTEGGVRA